MQCCAIAMHASKTMVTSDQCTRYKKKEDTYLGFELFQNTLCLSADTKQAPTLTAKHTNQTKSIVDLRNENLYSKTKPKKCTLLTLRRIHSSKPLGFSEKYSIELKIKQWMHGLMSEPPLLLPNSEWIVWSSFPQFCCTPTPCNHTLSCLQANGLRGCQNISPPSHPTIIWIRAAGARPYNAFQTGRERRPRLSLNIWMISV